MIFLRYSGLRPPMLFLRYRLYNIAEYIYRLHSFDVECEGRSLSIEIDGPSILVGDAHDDAGEFFSFAHSNVDQLIRVNREKGSRWFFRREAVDDFAGASIHVAGGYKRASYQYRVNIGDVDLSCAVVRPILFQDLVLEPQYISQPSADFEIDFITIFEQYS